MSNRKGERKKFWYRSERYFCGNGQWFFTTREGQDVGPFESKNDAELGLIRFVECIDKTENVELAVKCALEGEWQKNPIPIILTMRFDR